MDGKHDMSSWGPPVDICWPSSLSLWPLPVGEAAHEQEIVASETGIFAWKFFFFFFTARFAWKWITNRRVQLLPPPCHLGHTQIASWVSCISDCEKSDIHIILYSKLHPRQLSVQMGTESVILLKHESQAAPVKLCLLLTLARPANNSTRGCLSVMRQK